MAPAAQGLVLSSETIAPRPCQLIPRPNAEYILFLLGPRPFGSASSASSFVPRVPTLVMVILKILIELRQALKV